MAESKVWKYKGVLPPRTADAGELESQENVTSSSQFIPRRPQSTANGSRKTPRPHSIGATIISNPKLVKSWEYYDNDPKSIQKYFSTINLPPSNEFLDNAVGATDVDSDNGGEGDTLNREIKACVERRSERPCQKYLGILLTLVASGALALSSICVKAIPNYHPYSVSVWTFQGILLPSLIVLLFSCLIKKENVVKLSKPQNDQYSNEKNSGTHWQTFMFILIRALFGAGGVVLKCYSLQFMSVADSTIIAFSSPVFVVIAAWLCLREKLGIVPILTAIVVLVGIGVIVRPPLLTGQQSFDNDQLIGTGMAVSCMLLGVFTVIILRYIRHVHYAFINFVYGFVGTVGSLLLCYTVGEFQFPETGYHWFLAASIAGLTFVGQSLLTLALKYEQAGTFALVRTSEIVFTFFWQFVFLSIYPDLLSMIGALLVILGVIIITGRKWIETKKASHNARKWFGFLLK
ncbi:Solute carrier family 35 member G1 [Orchesella cincta]|uniref:Solute carrier family 35 member G1 n=1 Tax=Orchesella cincta TaxID=48709 RepID=A0A1D2MWY6_ORCCI|nr:Solute carrier family 35 member G1 [Orchesella cincta]